MRPRARMPAVWGGRLCGVVLGRRAALAQEAEWAPPSAWPQCASSPGGHQIQALRLPALAGLEMSGILGPRAEQAGAVVGLGAL